MIQLIVHNTGFKLNHYGNKITKVTFVGNINHYYWISKTATDTFRSKKLDDSEYF